MGRKVAHRVGEDAGMPEPGSVPMIRYATTTDGVSVAWQSVGSGPALEWIDGIQR